MTLHELLNEPYLVAMMRRESWADGMFVIRFVHRLWSGDVFKYPSFESFTPMVDDIIANDWKFIENLPKSVRDAMGVATTCEEVQGIR
jgi:hypothetical protein